MIYNLEWRRIRDAVDVGTVLVSMGDRYTAGKWIAAKYLEATNQRTGRTEVLKLGEFTICNG